MDGHRACRHLRNTLLGQQGEHRLHSAVQPRQLLRQLLIQELETVPGDLQAAGKPPGLIASWKAGEGWRAGGQVGRCRQAFLASAWFANQAARKLVTGQSLRRGKVEVTGPLPGPAWPAGLHTHGMMVERARHRSINGVCTHKRLA